MTTLRMVISWWLVAIPVAIIIFLVIPLIFTKRRLSYLAVISAMAALLMTLGWISSFNHPRALVLFSDQVEPTRAVVRCLYVDYEAGGVSVCMRET